MPIEVKKGDTFFTHSSSLLGRLIRWGETDPDEKGTNGAWANHTGVVVESGWIGDPGVPGYKEAQVVEALWHVRKGPLKLNGVNVRVFRPIPPYTTEELTYFINEATGRIGDRYGWWKLLLQLGDRALFKGKKVLSNMSFIDGRPICSYLAAHVNDAAREIGAIGEGYDYWPGFGMWPDGADPDEMMDFCLAYPNFWEEIK